MPTGTAATEAAQSNGSGAKTADLDKGPGSVAGNLCKDPDLRYTSTGRAVSSLRVAVSERVRNDKTGNWEDGPTTFFDITCWGQLAENVCEVLQRGDRIVAEGRWTETSWTDSDGVQQSRTFLTARDLGPSMMFRCARPVRAERRQS